MSKKVIEQRVLATLEKPGGVPYDQFLMEVFPGSDFTKDRELLLREVLAGLVDQGVIEMDHGWYRTLGRS